MPSTVNSHVIQFLLSCIIVAKVANVLDDLNRDSITDAAGVGNLRPSITLAALWGKWGSGVTAAQ